jgi:hypothetical protein
VSLNEINGEIIDAAMRIHSKLGPGLLEKVYTACLQQELLRRICQNSQLVLSSVLLCAPLCFLFQFGAGRLYYAIGFTSSIVYYLFHYSNIL